MNWTQIMGHLGGDAETRVTPNGQKVTSFNVATNYRRGDSEETVWWRVTVWWDRVGEKFMQRMEPYLKKGSAIIVLGELKKPEIWTSQDGQARVTLEITAETVRFSPFGKGNSSSGQQGTTHEQSSTGASTAQAFASTGSMGFASKGGFTSPIGASAEDATASNSEVPF